MEMLTGPEYGIKLVREESDGLAWDVMVARMVEWDSALRRRMDEEVLRVLSGEGVI